MNKILLICAMVAFPALASAASSGNVAVMESSVTVSQVSVDSGTAVDVTARASSMPDRTTLVIQNVDATYAIYCGGLGVTSATGFMVSPGGSISLNVRPYSQALATTIKFYCVSASTAGATKAAIIQGY